MPSALALLVATSLAQHLRRRAKVAARNLLVRPAAATLQHRRELARWTGAFMARHRARVSLLFWPAAENPTTRLTANWNGISAVFTPGGSLQLSCVQFLQRHFATGAANDSIHLQLTYSAWSSMARLVAGVPAAIQLLLARLAARETIRFQDIHRAGHLPPVASAEARLFDGNVTRVARARVASLAARMDTAVQHSVARISAQ